MRGLLVDLPTPHPLGPTLPILYQADAFVQRMCAALDEVLFPVILTLDNIPAYIDPATTPEDMIDWLAGWVGVALDAAQPAERRRTLVGVGAALHQWRGTAYGVERTIEALYNVTPEVIDSGGATHSGDPTGPMPGAASPELVVRLRVPDVEQIDRRQLDALITAIKPTHVPHRLEVLPVETRPVETGPVETGPVETGPVEA